LLLAVSLLFRSGPDRQVFCGFFSTVFEGPLVCHASLPPWRSPLSRGCRSTGSRDLLSRSGPFLSFPFVSPFPSQRPNQAKARQGRRLIFYPFFLSFCRLLDCCFSEQSDSIYCSFFLVIFPDPFETSQGATADVNSRALTSPRSIRHLPLPPTTMPLSPRLISRHAVPGKQRSIPRFLRFPTPSPPFYLCYLLPPKHRRHGDQASPPLI